MVKKYRVLIVDDDPMQHLILGDYLSLAGYDIRHAEDGEKGLRLAESEKPDLILLDIHMPGMDGFQVIEALRRQAASRMICIVFLTALDRQHLKIKGLELGADDYITKPYDRAELLARIKAVLRRSHRHHLLESVMEGHLEDVGLADLFQSMELGLKTASIHLPDLDALAVVRNGELLFSRQGRFTGDQALIRMFLLEKGRFSIQFNEIAGNAEDSSIPLTSVLMTVANEVDEIRDTIRQLGVEGLRIRLAEDMSEFPEIDAVRSVTPATFIELITAMDGNPRDNIRTLAAASRKKKLKVEKAL